MNIFQTYFRTKADAQAVLPPVTDYSRSIKSQVKRVEDKNVFFKQSIFEAQ